MTIHVRVRCEGVTPILFNRKTPELLQRLWTKEKAPRNAPRPLPRDHAATCLHTTAEGVHYLPIEMLTACLIRAGVFVRLDGKRQVSTATSTVLPAFIDIQGTAFPLTSQAWEVDMRGGVNPVGGEAICIVRPRFDKWGFVIEILIEDSEIDPSKIRELFDKAGSRVGLGDFRPARKGVFGKFRVECWEVLTEAHEHAAE